MVQISVSWKNMMNQAQGARKGSRVHGVEEK